MKEFDEDYLEHLKSIISDDKHEEARTELASLHPADIAELYRNLELEQAEYLFKLLDEEKAADVLMELDEDDRLKLLNAMPHGKKSPSRSTISIPTTPLTLYSSSTRTSARRFSAISTTWSRRATLSTS